MSTQTYPYYSAVKISAGQLLKVYKDKKFKSYNECYDSLQRWATHYPKSYSEGQYAIVEYTSSMIGVVGVNKLSPIH